MLWCFLPGETRAISDDLYRRRRIQTLVPHQGSRLAPPHGIDLARVTDGGHFEIACLKDRVACHVATGSIGEVCDDDQLLLAVGGFQQRLFREHLDPRHSLERVVSTALGNPLLQHRVDPGSFIKEKPALVGHAIIEDSGPGLAPFES